MKLALVVNSDDFFNTASLLKEQIKNREDGTSYRVCFFDSKDDPISVCKPFVMSRDLCETNPEWLQILPYITLYSEKNKKVFVYERGLKGNESRLHAQLSLGVGGHIEEQNSDPVVPIINTILAELEEEVDFPITDKFTNYVTNNMIMNNYSLFYTDLRPVDKVHLALSHFINVDPFVKKEFRLEEGKVLNGRWVDIAELVDQGKDKDHFEYWSQIIIDNYLGHFKT